VLNALNSWPTPNILDPITPIAFPKTPPPNLLYPIVEPSQPPPPTPFPTPNEVNNIISRNLRTINREARMKQNQLDREARQRQNQLNRESRKREREERKKQNLIETKPNVFLPPDNIKNDIITPPPDNFKNEIIVPPQGDLKTPDDSNTLKDAKITKDNKNIYLIGGALVAFLIIAMNKR
jgi:hypothetical protein